MVPRYDKLIVKPVLWRRYLNFVPFYLIRFLSIPFDDGKNVSEDQPCKKVLFSHINRSTAGWIFFKLLFQRKTLESLKHKLIGHKGPFQWDYPYKKKKKEDCKSKHFNQKNRFQKTENKCLLEVETWSIAILQNYWSKVFDWLPCIWFEQDFCFSSFFEGLEFCLDSSQWKCQVFLEDVENVFVVF